MEHLFDVKLAAEYGVLEAVLLKNIEYWVVKNEANGINLHEGAYWTYNSAKAFSQLFPYASPDQIRRALKHLRDEGLIKAGNFNEDACDRTLWYTLTDVGRSIVQNCKMHSASTPNANGKYAEPIPDIKPNIKPDIYYIEDEKPKKPQNGFIPPAVYEVRAFCEEHNYCVDPEMFIDHYTANGWMVGKTKMKDWRVAVRTWERRRKAEAQPKHFNGERQYDDDFFRKLEERDK